MIDGGQFEGEFKELGCRNYTDVTIQTMENYCGAGMNFKRVMLKLFVEHYQTLYETCYDPATMQSVWSKHVLYNEIEHRDTGSSDMPDFTSDGFFGDFDVATAYTKIGQRDAIAEILGSVDLANKYIDVNEGDFYLAAGHLSPKDDFIYKSWQRISYKYINTAPQWQCFNDGNWNLLENAIRGMAEREPFSPFAEIYTGTIGILELLDIKNNPAEIWLSGSQGSKRIPVPKFFWKVLYEPETQLGVALIGINNPHLAPEDVAVHKICPEISDHPLILELPEPGNIIKGVCYACSVPDAQKYILDMPKLEVSGVLMKGMKPSSSTMNTASFILILISAILAGQLMK